MFSEEDLIPISALQHFMFCSRQCGLIHSEQLWRDNLLTAQGNVLHAKVHTPGSEARGGLVVARGVRIRSLSLGLIGQTDVVEFSPAGVADGIALADRNGYWRPTVVEYKRGSPKSDRCDEVQLCAQVMCLEEMLSMPIGTGEFFYERLRRRQVVNLGTALRDETRKTIQSVRELLSAGRLPEAVNDKRCRKCSLMEECQPNVTSGTKSAKVYLSRVVSEL